MGYSAALTVLVRDSESPAGHVAKRLDQCGRGLGTMSLPYAFAVAGDD